MGRDDRAMSVRGLARLRRLALGMSIAALATVMVAGAGLLLSGAGGGPLLMAIDVAETTERPGVRAPAHGTVQAALRETAIDSSQAADYIEVVVDAGAGEEIRWFDGRPIRPVGTMTMVVTAYSPDEQSCGIWADGITASGYSVWTNGMKLVAADTSLLPFGTMVSVPGYDGGNVVPVLDRGGAIRGKRLDVLYPTHERALQWGVQKLEVRIWDFADGKPSGFRSRYP